MAQDMCYRSKSPLLTFILQYIHQALQHNYLIARNMFWFQTISFFWGKLGRFFTCWPANTERSLHQHPAHKPVERHVQVFYLDTVIEICVKVWGVWMLGIGHCSEGLQNSLKKLKIMSLICNTVGPDLIFRNLKRLMKNFPGSWPLELRPKDLEGKSFLWHGKLKKQKPSCKQTHCTIKTIQQINGGTATNTYDWQPKAEYQHYFRSTMSSEPWKPVFHVPCISVQQLFRRITIEHLFHLQCMPLSSGSIKSLDHKWVKIIVARTCRFAATYSRKAVLSMLFMTHCHWQKKVVLHPTPSVMIVRDTTLLALKFKLEVWDSSNISQSKGIQFAPCMNPILPCNMYMSFCEVAEISNDFILRPQPYFLPKSEVTESNVYDLVTIKLSKPMLLPHSEHFPPTWN